MCQWQNNNVQFARLLAEIAAAGLPDDVLNDLCASMDLGPVEVTELFDRAQCAFEKNKLEICPPENVKAVEFLKQEINDWANRLAIQERRYSLENGSVLCVKLTDDGIILDIEDDIGRPSATHGMDIDTLDNMCK